jgi:hypothetical protein
MKSRLLLDPVRDYQDGAILTAYKIKCDASNNDAGARARREFLYSLAVQITPNSQSIILNFFKVGQTVTVDSVLS